MVRAVKYENLLYVWQRRYGILGNVESHLTSYNWNLHTHKTLIFRDLQEEIRGIEVMWLF